MEAIIGIVVGLVAGIIVGALLMKMKAGGETATLRATLDAANERISDADSSTDKLRTELEDWRARTEERNKQVVQLQERFDASQSRFEQIEDANADLQKSETKWRDEAIESEKARAELQAKLDSANKQLVERADIEKALLVQFKNMASETLSSNSEAFAKAADEKIGSMVKPLSDELKRIEEARNKSQGSLTTQITTLMQNNTNLANEARNLTNALKRPEVRGSWGEMQLRRVVELAGMTNYCDYEEQVSVTADDGSRDRPDMVVRMPNDRTIVVDAKTPMSAYLTAVESDSPEERKEAIQQHAKQVKERANNLSQKSYQQMFDRSPDFVVMFLPGEYLLSAALENDRDLIDWAMQRNVIIATPNTLMALLKAVAMGWREAQIEEEAAKVAALGQELHDRLYTFGTHMEKMRGSLNQTVQHFNKGVGSLESRVFASARRFKEHGISSSNELPIISEIEQNARQLRALPLANIGGDD